MNGTLAAVAIGCAAAEVGVPTGPISANTLSSSISFLVAAIALVGLVAVVDADQLELAAVDAALGVDLVERGLEAGPHAEAERRGRAFEHGRLAEHDGVGGDAVLGERRRLRVTSRQAR